VSAINHFNRYLGIEIVHLDSDRCEAILPIRKELCNSLEGVVHGGVTSSLADVVMGHAADPPINGVQQCVTVENKVNYLRPAKGKFLRAESKVIKRGKKIVVMEATVYTDDGTVVALATGTYARVNARQFIEKKDPDENPDDASQSAD